MLVKFAKDVNLDDVGKLTERCDKLGIRYRYIQELKASYLIVESDEPSKLDELYHQFRHMDFVAIVMRSPDENDPLLTLEGVKFKCGNRWIGKGSKPVIMAGSPYLESQKHSVDLAAKLAMIGANVYKAGPYRPTETLDPKALYDRTAAIVADVTNKSGIPSTGMVEVLGPRTALSTLKTCAYHVPGHFLFETNLKDQLAKLMTPVLLERHPDASTELWLDAAREIIRGGNLEVALVETGRNVPGGREIDLISLVKLIENCPLPLLVYPARVSTNAEDVRRIARASLAAGCAGVIFDVHPNPLEGLLTEGFCLSIEQFESTFDSIKPLII
jgi:3-deoxy-7-phosphoheptulonate synthase